MKKIIYILLIITVLFGISGCKKEDDSSKFKDEYEALNNTNYREVSIDKNNPFIYSTSEEIIKKIENSETFYVYFGSQYCPWCRSVIEKAISVAKKNNIDKIYYINIWDGDHKEILRDTYELDEKGNPKLVFEGTKEYKKLLDYFDNVLSDYTLTSKDGNSIRVGEKRIFAPNFIYVKNGKAVKLTQAISEKQKSSNEELSSEILEDEELMFNEFFKN